MKKKFFAVLAVAFIFCEANASDFDFGGKENAYSADVHFGASMPSGKGRGYSHYNFASGSFRFSRSYGFVVRPELYRGFYASVGYQFNPWVQVFGSAGYGDGITGTAGVRFYFTNSPFTGFADVRLGATELVTQTEYPTYTITTRFWVSCASVVAGGALKDFDLGGGITAYSDGLYYLFMPTITLGWNIRCYPHK